MIPVHDSYIVKRQDLYMLERLMNESVKEVLSELGYSDYFKYGDPESDTYVESYTGQILSSKIDYQNKPSENSPIEDSLISDDIEELLEEHQPYQNAMDRYLHWMKERTP